MLSHRVPSWWVEAGRKLDRSDGRALLVPGLSKASSTWGLTDEDQLAWLTDQPWVARVQVPFGTYDSTRYLDVVEAAIAHGGDPALPTLLERAGITQVVVRNDSRWQQLHVPSPREVEEALRNSGLELSASYGPLLGAEQTGGASGVHPISIYSLPDASTEVARRFAPASSAAVVSGDSSSLAPLQRWGLTDRALVFTSDLTDEQPVPPTWIITDSNRRRTTSFGLTRDNTGYVLGAHDRDPNSSTQADARFYPGDERRNQTVRTYGDLRSVSASSYGSIWVPTPTAAPPNAVDGEPNTSWMPAGERSAAGEWIQLDLAKARRVNDVRVTLRDQIPDATGDVAIRASTDRGARTTKLSRGETGPQQLDIVPGTTDRVRLTIESLTGPRPGLGFAEIELDGAVSRSGLVVPHELRRRFSREGAALPIFVFAREPTSTTATQPHDSERDIRRSFVMPKSGELSVDAQVVAHPSPAVLKQLGTTPSLSVSASSTAGDLPRYAPRNAIDGQPESYWVAAYPDRNGRSQETITLDWSDPRTIGELKLTGVNGHRFPDRVRVSNGTESRTAEVDAGGHATFDPLVADHLAVDLIATSGRIVGSTPIATFTNPLALTEIEIPAIQDLMPGPVPFDQVVEVSCDDGPSVSVGGQVRRFAVRGTLGEISNLQPVPAISCEDRPVALDSGPVVLDTSTNASPFTIDSVRLAEEAALAPPPASRRTVDVDDWGTTDRSLDLSGRGPGYLIITENYNEGWSASIDEEELLPVVLDGWQQGFVVPAARTGTVELQFDPNTAYRLALVLGGALVLLVLVGALRTSALVRRGGE